MRHLFVISCLTALSFGLSAAPPLGPGHPTDATKNTEVPKTPDSKRWKEGFVVTLKGDTLQGKIKALDFLDIYYDYQHVVAFKDQNGSTQYAPGQIRSFSFYDAPNHLVTLQAVSDPNGSGLAFLRLYYSGSCKVYGMTRSDYKADSRSAETGENPAQSSLVVKEKKYIQVKNSQFYPIRRIGFRKNMKEVFASCPSIVAGLNSGVYSYNKWEALVRDYNKLENK